MFSVKIFSTFDVFLCNNTGNNLVDDVTHPIDYDTIVYCFSFFYFRCAAILIFHIIFNLYSIKPNIQPHTLPAFTISKHLLCLWVHFEMPCFIRISHYKQWTFKSS